MSQTTSDQDLLRDQERHQLEAQIKAYEYYAKLIERSVSNSSQLPKWDMNLVEKYRSDAQKAKDQLDLINGVKNINSQENEVKATKEEKQMSQETLLAEKAAQVKLSKKKQVKSSSNHSTFDYKPGLNEFSGNVGIIALAVFTCILLIYGAIIYESLYILPHLGK